VGRCDRASGSDALPCLSSNNSNETASQPVNKLTGGHKRTAYVLALEIQSLAKEFGIEKLGFLTLTFAQPITCIREAQRRFNSLNTGVLKKRYQRAIGCWERQKSGRIHFHLVVTMRNDIRSGFDFAGIARRDYRSAGNHLRSEWAFWRKTAPSYGFGRTELLPVKSTAEGIARYVGKYVSKHVGQRTDEDKGARVVRYIGFKPGDRTASCKFSWNTPGAWLWRQKLKGFCEYHGFKSTEEVSRWFGPRWAYFLQGAIFAFRIDEAVPYPSIAHMELEMKNRNQIAISEARAEYEGERAQANRAVRARTMSVPEVIFPRSPELQKFSPL